MWGLSRKIQDFKEHILKPIFRIKCFDQIRLHYNVPREMTFVLVSGETVSRTGFRKFIETSFLPVDFFFFFLCINARGMEIKFFQPLEISHMKDSREWHRIGHI